MRGCSSHNARYFWPLQRARVNYQLSTQINYRREFQIYLLDYPKLFFVPWSPGNVPQALDRLRNGIGAFVSLRFAR